MTELNKLEQAGLIASNLARGLGLPELLEAHIDDPELKMMHYYHFLIRVQEIMETGDITYEEDGYNISESAMDFIENNHDLLKEHLGLAPSKAPSGATIH